MSATRFVVFAAGPRASNPCVDIERLLTKRSLSRFMELTSANNSVRASVLRATLLVVFTPTIHSFGPFSLLHVLSILNLMGLGFAYRAARRGEVAAEEGARRVDDDRLAGVEAARLQGWEGQRGGVASHVLDRSG